jgi:ABC-2 type transport system permease protein
MRKIYAVMKKEFYHLIRDPRSLILAFIIPICLILLFGYALSLDVNNVETVIVDYDRSDVSRDLVQHLGSSPYFHVKAYVRDANEVAEYLDHGMATLGIIIPPVFTRDIAANKQAQVQVLMDGSDPNFANIARGYITAFMNGYNQKLLLKFINRNGMEKIHQPVDGRIRVWFNEDLVPCSPRW